MNPIDVVRAWKDEAYRASLTEEERALIPDNPAGNIEMSAGVEYSVLVTFVTLPIIYLTDTYLNALRNVTVTLIK